MKSGRQHRVEILERRHRRALWKRRSPIAREKLLPRGALFEDTARRLRLTSEALQALRARWSQ